MKGILPLVPLLVAALWIACDNRACLAQSEIFADLRPALVEECCLCLARRGTKKPGAACGEAALTLDGGVVIPPDAGAAIPDERGFLGDDGDDVIDEDEVPCLCASDASTCEQALGSGASIVVTGACVSQGSDFFVTAPCEAACRDVLTFDPPVVAP
jgi:hypothetical protein